MSVFDKVVAAVTPPESEEDRKEARSKAKRAAQSGDWLSMIVQHHEQIETAFAAVESATTAATRTTELAKLAIILTGHSNAEESVIYPALVSVDEKGHATMAYTEQAAAKTQMALLENIPPMSQDFSNKLAHIRGAVAHHVYEEEGKWFLELKEKAPSAEQVKLALRYREEFERYVGGDGAHEGFRRVAGSSG